MNDYLPEPRREDYESHEDYREARLSWAEEKLRRAELRLGNVLVENDGLRKRMPALEDQVSAYEKVIRSRERTTYFPLGTIVYVGPNARVQGSVLSVHVEKFGVFYRVGWWDGDRYRKAAFPADSVSDEPPMMLGRENVPL